MMVLPNSWMAYNNEKSEKQNGGFGGIPILGNTQIYYYIYISCIYCTNLNYSIYHVYHVYIVHIYIHIYHADKVFLQFSMLPSF